MIQRHAGKSTSVALFAVEADLFFCETFVACGHISLHVFVASARDIDDDDIVGTEFDFGQGGEGVRALDGRDNALGACQFESGVQGFIISGGKHFDTAVVGETG